jgi:hypothetical protein
MAPDLSYEHVAGALRRLGQFRVQTADEVGAAEADGISGALLLSLGLRESGLRNVNNQANTDHGCFQISEVYHGPWLRSQPGCPVGYWRPVAGHTAIEDGYCPRYTPALLYALDILHDGIAFAKAKAVPEQDRIPFAIASYNAGAGGALSGYRAGDCDKYTTGGDYSVWVLRHRSLVQRFLREHPGWKADA